MGSVIFSIQIKRLPNFIKMLSQKIPSLIVIVLLSVSLQRSNCDEHQGLDEKEQAVNAAYDYYKNLYLNFYGDASQPSQPASNVHSHTSLTSQAPNKITELFNRQDMLGAFSDDGLMPVLPGLVALAGVVGVALYLEGIRSRVASLETDQTSICSAVKTLGAIDVSSASTTDTTTGTELNALITAVEAAATPSCS